MEWFLFNGADAQRVQGYNCSIRTSHPTVIFMTGTVSYAIGIPFIIYGLITEAIYITVLLAIRKGDLIKLSCYKIMFVLEIYDMCAISVNSLLTGYLFIIGSTYCQQPNLIFVSGALGLGLWCGACMICFILVINRIIDLWKPRMMKPIFAGKRTYYILLVPIGYSVYFAFFSQPILFNSDMEAWFFDPFILNPTEAEQIHNIPHTANNLLIVMSTCVLYGILCSIFISKSRGKTNKKATWTQKSVLVQCSAICMANLIAALVYVYMQFFSTPKWLILFGHICWQAGHGIPAFVYLLMNKTIQNEVFLLFGIKKKEPVTAFSIFPSGSTHRSYSMKYKYP